MTAAKAPVVSSASASPSLPRPASSLQQQQRPAALPTPQQLLLQQQQQQELIPQPQRPPPIDAEAANDALQRAADSAAAAVRATVPRVESYINSNPELKRQLDSVALSGQPGFNKSALRLSPNDVGTLSQALQAANTVKTFLAALPSAAQQASGGGGSLVSPSSSSTAASSTVPEAGVFQTSPSPTGEFKVGSPAASISFNAGTAPLPKGAAATLSQLVAAVQPNLDAATKFVENVLPSPPPPPAAPASTALFAPAAARAAAGLEKFFVDAGASPATVRSEDQLTTASFGRRRLSAVAAVAAAAPAPPALAASAGSAPSSSSKTSIGAQMGQPVAAVAAAAADVAAPAAPTASTLTTTKGETAASLAPAVAAPSTPVAAAPAIPAAAASRVDAANVINLPKLQLPSPRSIFPALPTSLPPATAPTALELDAARPRPPPGSAAADLTDAALGALGGGSNAGAPGRAQAMTSVANALGSALASLSPALAPALGPLPISGPVTFSDGAASGSGRTATAGAAAGGTGARADALAPATGPRLPEVKVPTASAGVITLPAAVLPAPGAVDLKAINPKGDLIWTNMGGSGKGGAAAMASAGGGGSTTSAAAAGGGGASLG